ncbi:hypothetical protein SK128_001816, partial [Halocaridina rubra]
CASTCAIERTTWLISLAFISLTLFLRIIVSSPYSSITVQVTLRDMALAVFLLAALGVSCSSAELLELSYTYNNDAPTSPKLTQFTHKIIKKGLNKFGIWVELNEFCTSEHAGTHLDAPVHFAEHGWAVEAIPTKRLWRVPAVVIDVSRQIKFSGQMNYEVKVKDLEDWEAAHGVIPDGCLVIIRTGWGAKSKNIRDYSGLDQHNKNNFPGSPEAKTSEISHAKLAKIENVTDYSG